MGGWSAEREVSLVSGAHCAAALKEAGYEVATIDVTRDLRRCSRRSSAQKPDVVFNALHGRCGEDGNIQGVLELLGMPYTHSGVLASAVAMDKPMAKRLFADGRPALPQGRAGRTSRRDEGRSAAAPYVVKPANEGSSVGVQIITQEQQRPAVRRHRLAVRRDVLVEELHPRPRADRRRHGRPRPGRDRAAGRRRVLRLRRTNTPTASREHLCPAPLREDIAEEAMRMALVAHQTLGCRGVSRCDFRYDDTKGDDAAGCICWRSTPSPA